MMETPELIERTRRRYPASGESPWGPWTVLVEYVGIDLLALCATSQAAPGRKADNSKSIIGHELKVSRSDFRRELMKPGKRTLAIQRCTEFFMVTPKGLLKPEEVEFIQPEHFEGQAFEREKCSAHCERPSRYRSYDMAHPRTWGKMTSHRTVVGGRACVIKETTVGYGDKKTTHEARSEWELSAGEEPYRGHLPYQFQPLVGKEATYSWQTCEMCEGRGYMRKSVVELEAPHLWVPPDVGLMEVDGRGCHVVKKSPINHRPNPRFDVGEIVRWVSIRPDPRHHPEARVRVDPRGRLPVA